MSSGLLKAIIRLVWLSIKMGVLSRIIIFVPDRFFDKVLIKAACLAYKISLDLARIEVRSHSLGVAWCESAKRIRSYSQK